MDYQYNKNLPRKKLTEYPFITIALIAANSLIFLFMEFTGDTSDAAYMAEHGAMSWRFIFEADNYYRLVTCTFLHFGFEHLMNNMINLAVIGNEVEKTLGHLRFFFIYMLSGIGASFLSALYNMLVNHDEYIISAGASGAIFGILGSLLVISMMYPSIRRRIKPANVALIAVLSIFNGLSNFQIDNMAHLGGLLFGIIITFISCLCSKIVI